MDARAVVLWYIISWCRRHSPNGVKPRRSTQFEMAERSVDQQYLLEIFFFAILLLTRRILCRWLFGECKQALRIELLAVFPFLCAGKIIALLSKVFGLLQSRAFVHEGSNGVELRVVFVCRCIVERGHEEGRLLQILDYVVHRLALHLRHVRRQSRLHARGHRGLRLLAC